ncbi:hypothetical protein F7725_028853 [Dissostichus mawsoni]|uniref:ADP-ribosyl cyclase/cyclic ADP-ribose hydrolase n=1 Tax=Dissostichus mawsoni TaxID=36200 RepID=A0A7J5XGU0_DISMA|nr:hypothetical protein F7725_028853 [Dissostichus mawsoni]
MEHREYRPPEKRRRRRCIILSVVALLLLLIIVAVVLGLSLRQNTNKLKPTFIARCQEFKGYDCEKMWDVFEQAYVGRDPCDVPMEAYDPFIAAAPLKPACNRVKNPHHKTMMFWSKTKDLVHDFTEKRDCYVTVEDSLLGSVLDGLTWCGKEGSSDVACGDVTAMLNGSIVTPFHPASIFASIEVKRFDYPRVKA